MSATLPDPEAFNRLVWAIVGQIPPGRVSTYGQIASMIPAPDGVSEEDYGRLGAVWVGKAMNAVSDRDDGQVPWQRVINGEGGISLPEGSRAAAQQRDRLEKEGVKLGRNGRVRLEQYGWEGPADAWLRERGLLRPLGLKKDQDDPPGQLRLF